VRFEVDARGEARAVDVAADGNSWLVTIGGRVVRASMVRAGDRWSLLIGDPSGSPLVAGRSYDVMFEPAAGGAWQVHVDGRAVPAGARTSAQRLRGRLGSQGAAASSDGRVVAPMPGRVVKVLVTPGAAVEARQGVVVVEAMKMENELRAPRAGVVREVRVTEGASVDAQAVLVVID
jgi:biotin carboxyl carrier protein